MSKGNRSIIHAHYENSEFDRWAHEVLKEGLSLKEAECVNRFFYNTGALILDAGCGGGRLSLGLLDKGFTRIIGMDFSFKLCRSYTDQLERRCVSFNGDVGEIALKSATFDYVLCLGNLFSFLPGPGAHRQAMREIERILKPSGVAIFSVLRFWGRKINIPMYLGLKLIRLFQNAPPQGRNLPWLKKKGKSNFSLLSPYEPQAYWFTDKEFVGLAESYGLSPLTIGADGGNRTIGSALIGAFRKSAYR